MAGDLLKLSFQSRTLYELQTGLICTVLGAFAVAVVHFAPRLLMLIPPCLFRAWTGIPCPACGATRAGMLLSHFHLADAFALNPLFTLLFIGLALWGGNSILGVLIGSNIRISFTPRTQQIINKLFVVAFPVNWIYLILSTLLK